MFHLNVPATLAETTSTLEFVFIVQEGYPNAFAVYVLIVRLVGNSTRGNRSNETPDKGQLKEQEGD